MKQGDYLKAVDIIMKTLKAFKDEIGENCKGFLYGQFMKTKNSVKLIEYNFRPGDPEWMNTLSVIDDNIIDIIRYLIDEVDKPVHFEEKATVCKYIVPRGYPKIMNQVLDVKFDIKKIKGLGVNVYYSSGHDNQDRLRVGCERGIAFVSKADTISKANKSVEKAISMINGDFHYREDIGSKETLKQSYNG
jgi:phosphoribosylamine--glycine ligase